MIKKRENHLKFSVIKISVNSQVPSPIIPIYLVVQNIRDKSFLITLTLKKIRLKSLKRSVPKPPIMTNNNMITLSSFESQIFRKTILTYLYTTP